MVMAGETQEALKRVDRWDFTAEETQAAWQSSQLGDGLHLELPLATGPLPEGPLELWARLVNADGDEAAGARAVRGRRADVARRRRRPTPAADAAEPNAAGRRRSDGAEAASRRRADAASRRPPPTAVAGVQRAAGRRARRGLRLDDAAAPAADGRGKPPAAGCRCRPRRASAAGRERQPRWQQGSRRAPRRRRRSVDAVPLSGVAPGQRPGANAPA